MTEYSRYDHAVEDATKKGCVVVIPGPRELFIDIDNEADLLCFAGNISRLQKELNEKLKYQMRSSPSGSSARKHIVVTLERDLKSDEERILFQALLGSDRTREMLGLMRSRRGDKAPTLFFELKGGAYDPATQQLSTELVPASNDDEIAF